jgi:hypothetical protein
MRTIARIFIACFLPLTALHAQNFIYNGGFEEGDIQGADNSYTPSVPDNTADYIAYWRRADNVPGTMYHSPDWRYISSGNTFGREYNYDPYPTTTWFTPYQGNGMAGLGIYELIQQAYNYDALTAMLPAQDGKLLLKFRLRISNGQNIVPSAELKVYLSKNKLRYKYNDDPCETGIFGGEKWDKYASIDNNQSNYETIFTKSLSSVPTQQWVDVEYYFNAPGDIDKYQWIAFDVISDRSTGCTAPINYVYIDDVLLALGCPDKCSRTDGYFSGNSIVSSNVISPSSTFTISGLQGVSSLYMKITSVGGSLVYENSASCINGIEHPLYWDGTTAGGSPVADANYIYEITLNKAGCGSRLHKGMLSKVSNYTGPNHTNFNAVCENGVNLTPEPCCTLEPDMYKNNETLVGPGRSEYIIVNNIYACTNAPDFSDEVTIASGADILFRAGKQITLAEGFHTENKAVFVAEIVPCFGGGKVSKWEEPGYGTGGNKGTDHTVEEDASALAGLAVSVYPNPTTGTCNIRIMNMNNTFHAVPEYHVFNITGEEILSGKLVSDRAEIDLSGFAKGIYMVKMVCGEQAVFSRIIRQ